MKLYVSGPMTGYPDHNRQAFESAAMALKLMGHEPVTPVDLDADKPDWFQGSDGWEVDDDTYAELLNRDRDVVAEVDGVVFIYGWQASGGAGQEGEHAVALNKPLFTIHFYRRRIVLEPLSVKSFQALHTTKRLERT